MTEKLEDTETPSLQSNGSTGKSGPNKSVENQRSEQYAVESTFMAHAYLRNGAKLFAKLAKDYKEGSNYFRISAVLYSAFQVEAYLNHMGACLFSEWDQIERKLNWESKIEKICGQLGVELEKGIKPYQTIKRIFTFRDSLAHGRTGNYEFTYRTTGNEEQDFAPIDPPWLREFWSDKAVEVVISDVTQVLQSICEKAGHQTGSLGMMSFGTWTLAKDGKETLGLVFTQDKSDE